MQDKRIGFGLAGGCAAVVVMALATAAFVAPGHLLVRAAAMALGVGAVTAVLTDWRAGVGTTGVAVLVYIGFLVHRDGVLTGDPSAWRYTPVIIVAALLGRVAWRMRAPADVGPRFLTRS